MSRGFIWNPQRAPIPTDKWGENGNAEGVEGTLHFGELRTRRVVSRACFRLIHMFVSLMNQQSYWYCPLPSQPRVCRLLTGVIKSLCDASLLNENLTTYYQCLMSTLTPNILNSRWFYVSGISRSLGSDEGSSVYNRVCAMYTFIIHLHICIQRSSKNGRVSEMLCFFQLERTWVFWN